MFIARSLGKDDGFSIVLHILGSCWAGKRSTSAQANSSPGLRVLLSLRNPWRLSSSISQAIYAICGFGSLFQLTGGQYCYGCLGFSLQRCYNPNLSPTPDLKIANFPTSESRRRPYRRNLCNTVLTVCLSLLVIPLLYNFLWYPNLIQQVLQFSEDTVVSTPSRQKRKGSSVQISTEYMVIRIRFIFLR